jgi:hypothetical protein
LATGYHRGDDGSDAGTAPWNSPAPLAQAAGVAACAATVAAVLVFVGPRLAARLGTTGEADFASLDSLHAILVALAFHWSLVGRETRAGLVGFGLAAVWVLVLLLSAAAVFVTHPAGG